MHWPPVFAALHVAQPVVDVVKTSHMAVLAPPADHEPTGHGPDPPSVVAPAKQYLPAGQGRHVVAPARLYVPAGHKPVTMLKPAAAQYEPAVQSVGALADEGQK